MEVAVDDRGPLPGLDDIVGSIDVDQLDAASLESLEREIEQAELPLQATMGLRESLGPLISWFQTRKLVRELPEQVVALQWFECHVPHGGTVRERFESARGASAGVSLKVIGSGLEGGRSFDLAVSSEASADRAKCVSYFLDVKVLPRVYESSGRESVVGDVLEIVGDRPVEVGECPYCSVAPEAVDEMRNRLGMHLDLRQDSVGRKETIQVDWSKTASFEVGIDLPKLGALFSLTASVNGRGSWSLDYELKPGFLYQPYTAATGAPYLPPRWAYSA